MTNELKPQSRPRAIVLDLRTEGRLDYPFKKPTGVMTSDAVATSFKDALATAAVNTGLPIVVLVTSGREAPCVFEDIQRPQVTVLPVGGSRPRTNLIGAVADQVRCSIEDCLWLYEPNGKEAPSVSIRGCTMELALEKLDRLSDGRRNAAFSGYAPVTAEMAHTVLVPLDFNLGSKSNVHRLAEDGRLIFDAVLLVDGLIQLEGFALKGLEKLIAGYAPITYSLADDDGDETGPLRAKLRELKTAGARRVITVSQTNDASRLTQFADDALRSAGLVWYRTTWDELLKASDPIARS